jgi:diguanylate cyclase (GGDEF)-like protein
MRALGLRKKIILMMSGVLLLSAIAMIFFLRTTLYHKLFIKLQQKGLIIARQIAENSIDPILTEKSYELEMMTKDIKNSEENIEYIFILNNHGEVLAHTFNGGFPVDLKNVNITGDGKPYGIQSISSGEKRILDIAVPILKGHVGIVHLGISQDSIDKDINEIIMLVVWIILAVMTVGISASIFLSKEITKSVSELTRAVKMAGSGDLGHTVNIGTHDEIGQLAESFNAMTTDLKKREDELEHINSDLIVLQLISSAVTATVKMDELFNEILDAVINLRILNVAQKGVILIIEGERMKLAAQVGFTKEFEDAHRGLRVGECLCGMAAQTRAVIVSENSETDDRHTIKYPDITPHGHICIPLASRERVLGILCLYPPAGTKVGERELALFYTIGNQIGAAIDNIRLYEETAKRSLHDPLTGLANRRLMEYVLETSFAKAKRDESAFSAIMLDIDFFKTYNDTYGHTVGDNLLVNIARIIRKEIRQIDLGIRYGGEEFLVLLPETELSEACEVAERIRKDVEKKTGVTVSLGVSCYNHGMQKKEDIINRADEALLQAKQKGKNRVEVNV